MAGLGTTGVLIASFLLLLVVVSAIVAFNGVPGFAAGDDLGRLELKRARHTDDLGGPARLASRRGRETTTTKVSRGEPRAPERRRLASRAGRPEGSGAGDRVSGSAPGAPSAPAPGAAPSETAPGGGGGGNGSPRLPVDPGAATDALPQAPNVQAPSGQAPNVQAPSVGDVTGGLGDTVEQTTGQLGGVVGGVSPGLGQAVTETGQTLGGVLDHTGSTADGVVGGVVGGLNETTGGLTGGLTRGLGLGPG